MQTGSDVWGGDGNISTIHRSDAYDLPNATLYCAMPCARNYFSVPRWFLTCGAQLLHWARILASVHVCILAITTADVFTRTIPHMRTPGGGLLREAPPWCKWANEQISTEQMSKRADMHLQISEGGASKYLWGRRLRLQTSKRAPSKWALRV